PGSTAAFLNLRGIGERKLADLGPRFLQHIAAYCGAHQLALDAAVGTRPRRTRQRDHEGNDTKRTAFAMFESGASVEQVTTATGRALGTTWGYLAEFGETRPPEQLPPWIDQKTYAAVAEAVKDVGSTYLKPIYQHLKGTVAYEHIRLVVAHL